MKNLFAKQESFNVFVNAKTVVQNKIMPKTMYETLLGFKILALKKNCRTLKQNKQKSWALTHSPDLSLSSCLEQQILFFFQWNGNKLKLFQSLLRIEKIQLVKNKTLFFIFRHAFRAVFCVLSRVSFVVLSRKGK